MGWRYQPILRETNINGITDGCVSLCEVYLNEDDTLDSWTECLQCAPIGSDPDDLVSEIVNMLMCAMCWIPVHERELRVGMRFERAVDQKTRNDLATFIELTGNFLRPQ